METPSRISIVFAFAALVPVLAAVQCAQDTSRLIHKNEKVGVENTPGSRRLYEVHRRATRVARRTRSGRSAEVWSFEPPTEAEGWTRDIRAVIRKSPS